MAFVVDTATVKQEIEAIGVGAVEAGLGPVYEELMPVPNAAEMELLFSQANGIGLSGLRWRVPPYTGEIEETSVAVAQYVQSLGGKIHGAVSSPPAHMKNNLALNGGTFNQAFAADFGNHVCEWVLAARARGVYPIGVSLQNEPNIGAYGYNHCEYTPGAYAAMFNVVAPIMATRIPGVWAMGPNPSSDAAMITWTPEGEFEPYGAPYGSTLMANVTDPAWVGRLCFNGYGDGGVPIPDVQGGRVWPPLWATEYMDYDIQGEQRDMHNGMTCARQVDSAFSGGDGTYKGVSAWHYHEMLFKQGDAGLWGYVNRGDVPPPRFWTLGNYSRFVRPGFHRVASSGAPAGVKALAFTGPNGQIVIVAINWNAAPTVLDVEGLGAISTMRRWVTDETHNLARQADVAVSGGALSTTLPASSVTTLELLSVELNEVSWTRPDGHHTLRVEGGATPQYITVVPGADGSPGTATTSAGVMRATAVRGLTGALASSSAGIVRATTAVASLSAASASATAGDIGILGNDKKIRVVAGGVPVYRTLVPGADGRPAQATATAAPMAASAEITVPAASVTAAANEISLVEVGLGVPAASVTASAGGMSRSASVPITAATATAAAGQIVFGRPVPAPAASATALAGGLGYYQSALPAATATATAGNARWYLPGALLPGPKGAHYWRFGDFNALREALLEQMARVGAAQTNSTAADVTDLVNDFNSLLAKLRAAKIIAP